MRFAWRGLSATPCCRCCPGRRRRRPVRAADRAAERPVPREVRGHRPGAGLHDGLSRGLGVGSWVLGIGHRGLATGRAPELDLSGILNCVARGAPYGAQEWLTRTAEQRGLAYTMRPCGRPRKDVVQ